MSGGPRDEGQVYAQDHQDQLQQPSNALRDTLLMLGHGQVEHDGQLAE